MDGELLVFGTDSPFVRGAQLGFTFDVRANQRCVRARRACPARVPIVLL